MPKANAALQKALSLDENLPEAHAQAAAMALWFEWDWDAAESSFERALALNPGDAFCRGTYGWFLLNRKHFDEAIREVKQALALDPLMPLYYAWSTGLHTASRRYDEAIQEFTKAMEIDPRLGLAYFHAGCAYAGKGEFDTAIESLEKSKELPTKEKRSCRAEWLPLYVWVQRNCMIMSITTPFFISVLPSM